MNVLLVEDEEAIAEPLVEGLEREGFGVVHVATGQAALDAGDADLVLLDLRLPDIDGFEVCRRLRERSTVPIIVVSALDGDYVRSRGIQAGVACCFKKPVDMKALGESIRTSHELRLESMRNEVAEEPRRRR